MLAEWRDDLALCRCFDNEFSDAIPMLGDLVAFPPGRSRELEETVREGTAEWFPAKPER